MSQGIITSAIRPQTLKRTWLGGLKSAPSLVARIDLKILIPSAFLLVFVLFGLFPGLFVGADPNAINPAEAFQKPSLSHIFGTDQSGRDVFTRMVYGTRSSLLIGLGACGLGLLLAVVLGTAAGLAPKAADFAISKFLEVLFCFPSILLGLVFVTLYGPGIGSVLLAVGIGTAPGYARIIRSQVQSIASSPYLEASIALGRNKAWCVRRHVLPGLVRSLAALATLGVGQAIVWSSSLGYLGLGVTPPDAEWGAMLAAGRPYITSAWWLTVGPGLFIVIAAVAATFLGRALQGRIRGRA